eukprot:CAMPEP_0176021464 /NCGR_PEP_ID=MMETSP0120_2-20121206/10422_1 /TAXON_ID=160619 /ORGANISM="Kryptoperidinium foliaceum, Strain CCMP 1326" /LENGTH=288 /DNA_ID=CAMNT_0017354577 /DNA_START=12 /DNA_END=879 /DNA_ORIENTATION=+
MASLYRARSRASSMHEKSQADERSTRVIFAACVGLTTSEFNWLLCNDAYGMAKLMTIFLRHGSTTRPEAGFLDVMCICLWSGGFDGTCGGRNIVLPWSHLRLQVHDGHKHTCNAHPCIVGGAQQRQLGGLQGTYRVPQDVLCGNDVMLAAIVRLGKRRLHEQPACMEHRADDVRNAEELQGELDGASSGVLPAGQDLPLPQVADMLGEHADPKRALLEQIQDSVGRVFQGQAHWDAADRVQMAAPALCGLERLDSWTITVRADASNCPSAEPASGETRDSNPTIVRAV